jgi:aspartate 1-decarboxylase
MVIIISDASMELEEARNFKPSLIFADTKNRLN